MQAALNCADYEKAFDLFTHIRNLSQKFNDVPQIQVRKSYIIQQ